MSIDAPRIDTPRSAQPVSHGGPDSRIEWNGFKSLPAWYRTARWALIRSFWKIHGLEYALPALERELASTVKVPAWRKPGLWRNGFLSESAVLYGFPANDRNLYLSDLDRSVTARRINRDYGVLLDDKLTFERTMAAIAAPRPHFFGIADDAGRVSSPHRTGAPYPPETIFDLLNRHGSLVIKPARGGGGRGVAIVERREDDGSLTVNGVPTAQDALIDACAGMLIFERVQQHAILSALFPDTLNTIRVLTMVDAVGRPFVGRAVLRIGTEASRPTDNWIRGGLCATVDINTGRVGAAVRFPAHSGRLTWFDRHPESGAPITSIMLPEWPSVLETVLDVARGLPELPYVGWDIALTGNGPEILEGNSYSGVNLFQVHEPLLSDPRIRAFFARNGVAVKKN